MYVLQEGVTPLGSVDEGVNGRVSGVGGAAGIVRLGERAYEQAHDERDVVPFVVRGQDDGVRRHRVPLCATSPVSHTT